MRDRVKFRVGRIVYLAFSRDETIMGFAFPKEERAALVESDPDRFLMPSTSDLRYNWVCVRLATLDDNEMRALVLDAPGYRDAARNQAADLARATDDGLAGSAVEELLAG